MVLLIQFGVKNIINLEFLLNYFRIKQKNLDTTVAFLELARIRKAPQDHIFILIITSSTVLLLKHLIHLTLNFQKIKLKNLILIVGLN